MTPSDPVVESPSAREVIALSLADSAMETLDDISSGKYRGDADAILAAFDKAGFAVVPKELTEAMRAVMDEFVFTPSEGLKHTLYRAMLAAAGART